MAMRSMLTPSRRSLATCFGTWLASRRRSGSTIARWPAHIDKLKKRYPDGFTSAASVARVMRWSRERHRPPAALHRPSERSRVHRNHERLPFCLGNAIKYLWRCDAKKARPSRTQSGALVSAARAGSREARHGDARSASRGQQNTCPGQRREALPEPAAYYWMGSPTISTACNNHHMTRVLRRAEDSVEREIARRR